MLTWLRDEEKVILTSAALSRSLKTCGVIKHARTQDSEELRNQIRCMFCKLRASDHEILLCLNRANVKVTLRGLLRIRKELGLRRWEQGAEVPEPMDQKQQELLEQELIDHGLDNGAVQP